MDHDTARAADIAIALIFLIVAAGIMYNAAMKAEPLVAMAVRYWKRGTQG